MDEMNNDSLSREIRAGGNFLDAVMAIAAIGGIMAIIGLVILLT